MSKCLSVCMCVYQGGTHQPLCLRTCKCLHRHTAELCSQNRNKYFSYRSWASSTMGYLLLIHFGYRISLMRCFAYVDQLNLNLQDLHVDVGVYDLTVSCSTLNRRRCDDPETFLPLKFSELVRSAKTIMFRVLSTGDKKLISRWESERELSLRLLRTRTRTRK